MFRICHLKMVLPTKKTASNQQKNLKKKTAKKGVIKKPKQPKRQQKACESKLDDHYDEKENEFRR